MAERNPGRKAPSGKTAVLEENRGTELPKAPEPDGRQRVLIEGISPEIDGGRFPAKRTVGDLVQVQVDLFTDGHDSITAALLYRHEKNEDWTEVQFTFLNNDRWFAEFTVTELGRYRYRVIAWVDQFFTWRKDLLKRIDANTDTPIDYQIGANLIAQAVERAKSSTDKRLLQAEADFLRKDSSQARRERGTAVELNEAMLRNPDRGYASDSGKDLVIVVDPVRARFSSWYEFFPRSASPTEGQHGTFRDCEARLPYVAEMGFDVLYFPPIHPIGTQFRKGRNNTTTPEPGDVGSPWAIGAAEGGHKAIHPDLGTLEDFRSLVKKADSLGIQIALDIAFQVSPDHPYVREHEEWFKKRPDGTIQYAENPPKKYQDIYPFDFETSNWWPLWTELKSVFDYWIAQGIRIFRVDNPHTKAFPFWEWCITAIKQEHPEVLFLSEAFTRPKIMYRLAKLGFSQSYTYFPWRNNKFGLMEYLTETCKGPVREFFRPNQWPNTPDILTEFLQLQTQAAFTIRYLLAATLGANYGIYGPAFELLEGRAVRHGSEEYLDSEKYQIRHWDLEQPNSLRELITLVNRIRRNNPALQTDWTIDFHPVDNDQLLCFSKESDDGKNRVVVVINLDPNFVQSGFVDLPLNRWDMDWNTPYQVHDLLTEARYVWTGGRNYVRLDPQSVPGHIFRVSRHTRTEGDFDYFG